MHYLTEEKKSEIERAIGAWLSEEEVTATEIGLETTLTFRVQDVSLQDLLRLAVALGTGDLKVDLDRQPVYLQDLYNRHGGFCVGARATLLDLKVTYQTRWPK